MDATVTNTEPTQGGYRWRPPTPADLPGIHTLLLAAGAAEGNHSLPTLEDLEREFDDTWSDPAVDARLFFAPDGSVAAFARLYGNPEPADEIRIITDDDVHPAHRDSLHDAVLAWLEARGAEKAHAIAAATGFAGPAVLRVGAPDHMTDCLARYERHGFHPLRHFFRMRRDLSQPIPDRSLPAGLTVTPFRPELSEAVRLAHSEAFSDHWGSDPTSVDDWQQFMLGNSAFRADLSPIVFDGDQVAAFSMNRVDPEENARQPYTTGWIGSLGTRRPWRKRGLASALLVWSLQAFRAEGLAFASLGVDAQNPTGALGLYEGLGFVTFRRYTACARPIALTEGATPGD